jgi:hypothetical protein
MPAPLDLETLIVRIANLSDRERLDFARALDEPTMNAAGEFRRARSPEDWGQRYLDISAAERKASLALDTFRHDGSLPDVSASVFFDPAYPQGAATWSWALVVVRAMARTILLDDAGTRAVLAPAFDLLFAP